MKPLSSSSSFPLLVLRGLGFGRDRERTTLRRSLSESPLNLLRSAVICAVSAAVRGRTIASRPAASIDLAVLKSYGRTGNPIMKEIYGEIDIQWDCYKKDQVSLERN